MYRGQQQTQMGGRIAWGPFPIRPWRLLGAAFALAIALAVSWMGLRSQTLVCERGQEPVCRADGFLTADARLAGRTLSSVDLETVRRGKGQGTEYGTVILKSEASALALMEVAGDDARGVAERLERFRTSSKPRIREDLHGSRWLLVLTPVALLVAVSLARSAVAGIGSVDLVLRGGSLEVTRRVLGLRGTTRSVPVARAEDVVVDFRDEKDFWLSRGQRPRRLGRIAVVQDGGLRTPVTEAFWPGQTLHLRAASALRAALDLAPRPGGVEEMLHAAERAPQRPQWAQNLASRLAMCWLGVCCGAIFGIAVLGTVAAALGAVRLSQSVPEWIIGGGAGGGAIAGVVFVLWLARARVPR